MKPALLALTIFSIVFVIGAAASMYKLLAPIYKKQKLRKEEKARKRSANEVP
jgi:hypothetical protein